METIVQNTSGAAGLFINIDHPDVLQCRPDTYLYKCVEQRLLKDEGAMRFWVEACAPYIDVPEWGEILTDQTDDHTPYWNNGYFSGADASSLVATLRHWNPQRYVEIGCGNSTKFARWAIQTWGLRTHVTCIDPVPRTQVRHIADNVIEKSLLEVEESFFETLEAGDILFHDGSHLVFNGTDTTKLFLEVLPLIKSGVIVHIHDICLPWEYTRSFDNRGYNEQYMLATLLLFGSGWEVFAPVTYLNRRGLLKSGGVSFWMRKR